MPLLSIRKLAALLPALAMLAGLPQSAPAQQRDGSRGVGSMMNFEAMADSYAKLLVRRYNLTPEQDQFTEEFIKSKTREFLDRHEGELRVLIDDLFAARTGGEFSQEQLMAWGQHVQPIYEEAKQIIIEGNDEWRQILTEEQKQIHDGDLKLMWESFGTTEDQLDRIVSGEMTVEEFRNPQRHSQRQTSVQARPSPRTPDRVRGGQRPAGAESSAQAGEKSEPRATLPAGTTSVTDHQGRVTQTRTPRRNPRGTPVNKSPSGRGIRSATAGKAEGFEGEWDKYTKDFIEKYQLNDDQKQKAQTILESSKKLAQRHVQRMKSKIEALDKQTEELKSADAKERSAKMSAISKERAKLFEPINQIFERRLKPQLDRLPSRAQREAAEAAEKNPRKPAKVERREEPPPEQQAEELQDQEGEHDEQGDDGDGDGEDGDR